MEEQYYLDRARLRDLMVAHPAWKQRQYAEAIGRSLGWVKKWVKRLREADPADETVLWGQSRARKTPPAMVSAAAIERILAIRDHPPKNLERKPGPRAILHYLHEDETWQAEAGLVPHSTSTIWKVLKAHGRIPRRQSVEHEPIERPAPMVAWQIDFKDVSTVPADPEGKQKHVVEVLNVVDAGTSILVEALPRADYSAETAILAITTTLLVHGLPQSVTFDRDPRFVGGWTAQEFPSAFMRYLLCLDIALIVCPPRRPDRNAFVERYHRTYEYECLRIHRPPDLEQVEQVTAAFKWHYNHERPHQSKVCGNRPPCQAFPELPVLPSVPEVVDPDHWLKAIHKQHFKRRVQANGTVQLGNQRYYVGQRWRGRYVLLQVDATERRLVVYLDGQPLKTLPIKGLYGRPLRFQDYLRLIGAEAVSEWRHWQWKQGRQRSPRYTM